MIEILVKLYEICAIPYSSIYQPIPFTAFNLPGIRTGSPFASKTFFPVMGLPSRFTRPASRISKAIEFARRVEVEFKFTLYAIKKSRAEIAIAPVLAIFSLKFAGPKSGFHSGSANFA